MVGMNKRAFLFPGQGAQHVGMGKDFFEQFEEARNVYLRGKYMQEATDKTPTGMVAVLGLTDKDVEGICQEVSSYGVVCAANYNCPGQVVISGENDALGEP